MKKERKLSKQQKGKTNKEEYVREDSENYDEIKRKGKRKGNGKNIEY